MGCYMAFNYKENEFDLSIDVFDDLFGTINIPYPFSYIIKTPCMMRLKDIGQTGFAYLDYPKLKEGNRLIHSIGTYYIMSKILNRIDFLLKEHGISLPIEQKQMALCAMLLHDVGHGPFSHAFEQLRYNLSNNKMTHEEMTYFLITGNTEINALLVELFGEAKTKKIASFISKKKDSDFVDDDLTKLIFTLVSYQIDSDRLEYSKRDSSLAGKQQLDIDSIINCFDITVDCNGRYELIFHREGLDNIENVLIKRYQMYRDIYLGEGSVLGDYIFSNIGKRYLKSKSLQELDLEPNCQKLLNNLGNDDIETFLKTTNKNFDVFFQNLSINKVDSISAYLAKFNLSDFIKIPNNKYLELKEKLEKLFGVSLKDSIAIFEIKRSVRLYNNKERINLINNNRICDLSECSHLINPLEVLNIDYSFVNFELLRLELGLSKEEFVQYVSSIQKILYDLNLTSEEFQLKYILDEDNKLEKTSIEKLLANILYELKINGFKVLSNEQVNNSDYYFDNDELLYYYEHSSLRIRESSNGDKKATFKKSIDEGVYSRRFQETIDIKDDNLEELQTNNLVNSGINFENPNLNIKTSRSTIMLEKNGVVINLSIDYSQYNNLLNGKTSIDQMIEFIPLNVDGRVMLIDIHQILAPKFNLTPCCKSKYERAIEKTKLISNKQKTY